MEPERLTYRLTYNLCMPNRSQFNTNEEYNDWFKKYRKKNKKKIREIKKKSYEKRYLPYKDRYPDKYRAHKMVAYALRIGQLVRMGCAKCSDKQTHGHHEDYSKPLEVVWLCRKHHTKRHIDLKKISTE